MRAKGYDSIPAVSAVTAAKIAESKRIKNVEEM